MVYQIFFFAIEQHYSIEANLQCIADVAFIIIIIIMYANLYSAITLQKITRALYIKIVTGYKL